ncbi:hypothetical protein ARALYDRAFT_890825 [Arabidopsis lyrata subsp. lyrata]|uniref:Isopropylmalate dehydrogenase-like domain-containing protein n=1 Tax=Arabidopsis lyrata subsp. lyrata TaxID=81972 RepID=D7KHL0_ARALL|nr:hypothetical protein ARALYDRAFT_890825 [Arabidopsis lyrata subsp. lyrata]
MYGRKQRPHLNVVVEKSVTQTFSTTQKNLSSITTGSGIQTRSATYLARPVTVIHGVLTNAVEQVMDAMHAPVYFETYYIKGKNMNHLPREVVDSIRKNKVCLNGREHEVVPGVIQSFQVTMTKFWSDRIAKYAFEYAKLSKRKKVTAVHNKGKHEKLADSFFLESCQEVAKMYPSITYNEIGIDKCCLQLVEKPERFDVIVTPNLYGNIIANIAVGIAGGGNNGEIIPGGSFGSEYAIFDQVGSVENHKNPVALLFSSVMMLRHLLLPLFADRLETAMKRVVSEGKCGNSNTTTQEVVDAVIANLD